MSTVQRSQGVLIEVAYFEIDANGFDHRHDFPVSAPYDAPLAQSILQNPLISAALEDNDNRIVCKGDNFKGEVIDLRQKPFDVDYIFDSLRTKKNPVLYITSTNQRHDSGVSLTDRGATIYRRPSISVDVLRRVLQKSDSQSTKSDSQSIKSDSDSDSEPETLLTVRQAKSVGGPDSLSITSEQDEDVPECEANQDTHPIEEDIVFSLVSRSSKTLGKRTTSQEEKPKLAASHGATLRHPLNKGPTITKPSFRDLTRSRTERDISFEEVRKRRGAIKRGSTLDLNVNQVTLQVHTEDGYTVTITTHSHVTVGELKQMIGQELSLAGKLPGANGFTLTYSVDKTTYELVNDSQFLINTLFLNEVNFRQEVIPGLVVRPLGAPVHKDLVIIYRITQLTRVLLDSRVTELGVADARSFTTIAAPDRAEMEAARRTLHDYVTKVTSERETEDYTLSVDIAKDDAPTTLILKIPYNNHIPITFHHKKIFSFTKEISIHKTAESTLKDIYHCLHECGLTKSSVDAYTMQISGIDSYIHGNHELIAFTDIRRCITKKEPIHLSVLQKPSTLLYQPFEISWLPIDPNSYKPPHQADVSQSYRRETKSIWECPDFECFKLRLVRAENLAFDSTNLLTAEFSLHHGSEMIHGVRTTTSQAQDSFTMKWNEEIDFITNLKDLPKSAKVLVVLRNTNSNSYYWGMINVFNHRSMLRSGDHTLYMWEVKLETVKRSRRRQSSISIPIVEKEAEAFSSILSGPAVDNPSSNAVRLVISFKPQDKPLYYPSVSQKSRSKLFQQHPALRKVKLKKHFHKYFELRFNLRSNKGAYHNLPVHLQTINWSNFKDRLEVYDVLDKIKESEEVDEKGKVYREMERVPLYVAFRLLDKDFPDEEVRAFATKVVECKVQSDSLEDYLLQLTQALKFEHNHDSPLARYLLKQALTNERIGHMFFWYLRGEMQNPQYMLRFAVILEAYLKGCGEALLTKFMDQMTMQNSLEEIGHRLKYTYGKDSVKMQQALPQELSKHELQKISLIPVYNPRLRLGGLRPGHCKIMSSAKKPMYLEMLNVNATALRADPVRLIMKMGDDLRQDMMTLRMLSLFEKLWENEGLDLKLIPYGCVATGSRTGFIEVVKNSKTIAEVSGVRENKKLYEWIKSHQTDEFGEEDSEKMKTAIDTFVHSCAGYSVATYILGIGDRHNDNIMITTSGNLFHIDFGHFLGNIKHFMTFKREWAPFVLTPDFTYVMGGEESESFNLYKHLCIRAFLVLRRHADLIINLFSMMRATGIPELTCVEDTDYIKTALALGKTDTEAEKEFKMVIQKCLDLKWTVQIMWAIHKLRGTQSPKRS